MSRKTIKPTDVTAIIDTREQAPFDLEPLKQVKGTLTTGDYSIIGLEHVVAVERKSLQDLIGCVGKHRERFEKEIQRLMAYPVRALVVEADWSNIELKQYRGEVSPNAALGSIYGWMAKGLPVYMAGDRKRAQDFTTRFLFIAARRRWAESQAFIKQVIEG